MSVVNRILYHRPDAFYILSGASPYVDVSRRRLANITPTVTRWPVSPARGILETVRLAAATTITLHKAPDDEFTLMTQTKPLTTSSTNLLSFYGLDTEGLWQNGNTIYFGVRHLGGTFTTVSAEIDASAIHIVAGVAASDKITLYIDGSPAVSKEITDPAIFDVDNTLTLGDPNAAVYSFAAAWHKALGGQAIADIQESSRPAQLRTAVLGTLSTADLRLTAASADLEQFVFSETHRNLISSVDLFGTTIKATYDTSLLSVAGNVRFAVPFVSTTGGIRVSWGSSNGAVVKYSTDGTTFNTISNGQSFGTTGTIADQPLIEVSFPSGSATEMFLDSLTVERQISGLFNPVMSNGRAVTLLGSVNLADTGEYRKYRSLPATLGTDGRIVIAPETEDPSILTYGVEMWYTPSAADLTGTTKVLIDNNPEATNYCYISSTGVLTWSNMSAVYINKATPGTGAYTLVPGVPVHLVFIFGTPHNSQIRIGWTANPAAGNISALGIIRQSVTAGDVTTMFDSQQDIPVTRPTTGEVVAGTDTAVTNLNLVWTGGSQ